MWARTEGGTVAELTDIDPTDRYHPSLEWVACPPGAAEGWTYADGAFAAPPPPPPPPPIRTIRALAFRRRLSVPTREAITAAAMSSASIRSFLDDLGAAQVVELDDAETVAAVATLRGAGLLTEAEATALLADGTAAET